MQYMQFTAARADTGAVLPLAHATVYLTGTSTKASLFDNTGTPIGNPVTASSVGLVSFAVADGLYDIAIQSSDGLYNTPTMVAVQVFDLAAMAASVALIPGKANLASPTLTGTPLATTASAGTNTTQIATTGFVTSAVGVLTSGADTSHDTFLKIQNILTTDEATAAALATTVGGKLTAASNLSDLANVASARQNLQLRPGVEVQGYATPLAAMASGAIWSAGIQVPVFTNSGTVVMKTIGTASGNMLDKASGDALYASIGSVGTGLTNGDKGDITVSGTGSITWTIDSNVVSFAKFQSAAGNGLVGANTSGNYQHITIGPNLLLSGGVLSATGGGGGSGSVTTVTGTGTQGVSISITNPTTTPALTIGLGAITPTSVAATGTVTGSNLSGTNTGDQDLTSILSRISVLEGSSKPSLPSLTTSGATYHAIYSTDKLVPTYSGSAYDVIRNSDSATVALGFTGDTVAAGDVAALRGSGTALRVSKWYDQSGNGRHMTQTVSAQRPALHETMLIAGTPALIIDGTRNTQAVGLDFTHALTGQAVTWFIVADQNSSTQQQLILQYSNGTTGLRTLYHEAPTVNSAVPNAATASIDYAQHTTPSAGFNGKHFRSAPAIYCIRENGANPADLYIDGVKTSATAQTALTSAALSPPAESLTTGYFGYPNDSALQAFYPNMRGLAMVAVAGALNETDIGAVTNALLSHFRVARSFSARVVIIGDSIAEGSPPAATLTRATSWWLRQQTLKGTPEIYNLGIGSKLLTAMYTDRSYYEAKLYTSGVPVIFVIEGGINDLRTGTSASTLYSTTSTYVSYLKSLGTNVKVIVNTLLKSGLNDSTQAAAVVSYNSLVRSNSAGADAINDQATEPHVAATGAENDTTLFPDLIHPSSLTYSYIIPYLATTLNTLLP